MQIDADHIAAITCPIAVAVVLTVALWASVQGCKIREQSEIERIKSGMIEVYDPVAHRVMWANPTNVGIVKTE